MEEDLILLDRWRSGERQAGEDLFARHFDSVYRFFEHKVGPEADELVQRTFLACVASRDQFRGQSSFRTYLFAIARNELYGPIRRRRGEQVDFGVTSLADLATSPSSRLGKAQAADALRGALEQLPAEQQLLLELHYWQELDAAALAEVFAIPPGTVRVRLVRARKALRAVLGHSREGRPAGADALSKSLSLPETEPDDSPGDDSLGI